MKINLETRLKEDDVLSKEEIVHLLSVENFSKDYYYLLFTANLMTRKEFENKGYLFAQIGINAEPCTKNCKFCSMGENHYSMESQWKKSDSDILKEAKDIISQGIDDLFLMATADYDFNAYINIIKKVKKLIPQETRLVANIGDFDFEKAIELKSAGVTGAYHVHRLREGMDTDIQPEDRIKTLDAINKAGLELYYCVEPIGAEHDYEEIADEIIRARDYNTSVMAVMKRTPVQGTPLSDKETISETELCKIAAVSRIAVKPTRAMNAHEVSPMTLLAGVNQLYAESGSNPRDRHSKTEKGRGYCVENINQLLRDVEYEI